MQFTKYRSKALHIMWKKFWKQYNTDERNLVRKPRFSTWQIDDICAGCWKNHSPIEFCADILFEYAKKIQEDQK